MINWAPAKASHGETFHVGTPQASDIATVTWVRLSSVTHSFNSDQRFNRLASQPAAGGLDVTAPASANVCPPGHYMMFLINSAGVPSVAKIMQVTAPAAHPHLRTVSAAAPEHPAPRDVVALHEAVVRAARGTKVVVGLTGSCPYGIAVCWGGAYEALTRLEGVGSVDPIPDGVASTATVFLPEGGLPSLERWREQFRRIANESYLLRGIEVTLAGTIEARGEELFLNRDDGHPPVRLAPLNPADKVQWDSPARAPQAVAFEEAAAYAALRTEAGQTRTERLTVTGPLQQAGTEFTVQVREAATARGSHQTDREPASSP